jgi:hypothetical protein
MYELIDLYYEINQLGNIKFKLGLILWVKKN